MKAFNTDHYGEDFYWFFAKVVSDSDPEYLGRVQIRVYGIHSQDQNKLPDSHLPWAQCLIPSTEGGISGIGQHSKILPGALVFGFFMDGRSCQIPFVLGAIHHNELPIPTQSDNNSLGERFDVYDPRVQNFPETPISTDVDTLITGGTTAEKIFNFFTKNGLQPHHACGIIGNFYAESTLNPEAVNPDDKGKKSEGLAQWRGVRREQLIAFCASSEPNLDYKSLTGQLNFVLHEFKTTEQTAYGKLMEAETPQEAAIAFSRYYERPEYKIVNGNYVTASLDQRVEAATDAYRRFARIGAGGR
jgi:hypothetical protein|tara:strand:+ start:2220 stop:3125 length:906 start_codon:yes stop_codon:yes gene_type:complete